MAILIEAGTFHSNAWLCTLARVKWIHALPNRLLLLYCSVQRSFSNITVHCFLYFLFSIPLHPTHIQETCLPAGSGSAQRRLQPVRKNSHLAPHASLSPSNPTASHISHAPSLAPITPLSSSLLLFLPFDSDHWVSLCLRMSEAPFCLADGQEERRWTRFKWEHCIYVCLWHGRGKSKEGRWIFFFLGG